jgi:hypothetical protein
MGCWMRIRRVDWQVATVLRKNTFEPNSDNLAVCGLVES